MSTPPRSLPPVTPATLPKRRRRGRLLALTLVLVGGLASAAVAAGRMFSAGADTQALSATVQEAAGGDWQPNIQVRVGPLLLAVARLVVTLVPDVPPEARTALQALRAAEVSIDHLDQAGRKVDRAGILANADARMTRRGWERIVGVIDGDQVVAVYTPAGATSARNLSCCVVVLDHDQLITVKARGDIERMADLAWRLRDGSHDLRWH